MTATTRSIWSWAALATGGVTVVVLVATHTIWVALIAGVGAGVFAATTGLRINRLAESRIKAYAAAARGELPRALDGELREPAELARQVQSTAANALDMSRKLSVLRAVIDGMAEGVWITSVDGTVAEHNNALKEMLYSGQAIAGQRPSVLLQSEALQAAVDSACREGQSTRLELAIEGLRPRVLSIHVSPLGRELGGSAAVFFDVTELRRLEKVRKDFVANVSHELRTPITAIRGYSETLQSGALQDPVAAPKMVEIIHRQSERLSELVEDLLELSRLESREMKLAEKPVDLANATGRALDTVRPKSKERGTAIALDVPAGLRVLGDQRAVEQIILNLLDNAVKYTRPHGHVWVSATELHDEVVLKVKDDGPGIEARHLPRIFERFYRVDKGRSRDMGGTGLGLSIVKHLANSMHGDVRVESAPGRGSTFTVHLKRCPPAA